MSGTTSSQHLDISAGRDVVFCHACEHEWFQDQHGLTCPQCQSEATEIVTPENDPRPARAHDFHDRPHHSMSSYDDSDPEEEGIDEQSFRGPGNIFVTTRHFGMPGRWAPSSGASTTNPEDREAVMGRLYDLVNRDLGGSGHSEASEGTPSTGAQGGGDFGGRTNYTTRTTVFPGRSASFTITTAPLRQDGANPRAGDFNAYASPPPQRRARVLVIVLGSGADSSASILSAIMGNITNPVGNTPHGGGEHGRDGSGEEGDIPPHGFPIAFQQLIGALLMGPGGSRNWGDVVTSQEEFDRIISQMMDSNTLSNAAPPASQAAIEKLQRKKLDQEMMGTDGKVECTICMDEMNVGDDVTVLPCKHWYHGECVVTWLKEHYTCPICRAPIEERNASGDTPPEQQRSSNPTDQSRPNFSRIFLPQGLLPLGGGSGSPTAGWASRDSASRQSEIPPRPDSNSRDEERRQGRRVELLRSPSTNEERLRAIRGLALMSDNGQGSGRPTTPPPSESRRRNSMSPPSPSMQAPWNLEYDPVNDYTSASRDRARERDGDRVNSQSTSRLGAMNWGSHDGERERRRYPGRESGGDRASREQQQQQQQQVQQEQQGQGQDENSNNQRRSNNHEGQSSGSNFNLNLNPLVWIRDRFPGTGSSSGDGNRRS